MAIVFRHVNPLLNLLFPVSIAIHLLATAALAQDATDPIGDALFDKAFAAVVSLEWPIDRLIYGTNLARADAKYGDSRFEERLLPFLKEVVDGRSEGNRKRYLASYAQALAEYGRTSELLAVMRELNDVWNYGSRVLRTLVENQDIATALILAEQETEPAQHFHALLHIISVLFYEGERQSAEEILADAATLYETLRPTDRKAKIVHYAPVLAHFDPAAAEAMVLGLDEDEYWHDLALGQFIIARACVDPQRALALTASIKLPLQRGFVHSVVLKSILRATVDQPDRLEIFNEALVAAEPGDKTDFLVFQAGYAIRTGEIEKAENLLNRAEGLLSTLSDENHDTQVRIVQFRILIAALKGEIETIFEKIDASPQSEALNEDSNILMLATNLRLSGHPMTAERLIERLRGDSNFARYYLDAIREHFAE